MLVINEALINRYGHKDYLNYAYNEHEKYGAIAALDTHLEREPMDCDILLNDLCLCGKELSKTRENFPLLDKIVKTTEDGFRDIHQLAKEVSMCDEDELLAEEYPYGFLYVRGVDLLMELKNLEKMDGYINHLVPRFFG